MKRLVTVTIIAAVALVYMSSFASAAMKFAYVDLQRALMEVSEGKTAKAELKVYFDKKQAELDKETERLKKMKEDLDRQGMMVDPKVKAEREAELQQAMYELQKVYMSLQQELKSKETEAVAPILEKMQMIIKELAEKNGYDLVLDKNGSGIVYAPLKFDLTTELVKLYDKRYPAKKKK